MLKMLPGVDHLLERAKSDSYLKDAPKALLTLSIRKLISDLRGTLLSGQKKLTPKDLEDKVLLEEINILMKKSLSPNLKRVINATGIVVHTNLGRSLLADDAIENIRDIGGRYSNLEFDLTQGKRGSRYSAVEDILCEISGAEAALVVNNNAGAVLLSIETIAKGLKVIVSRGELVEIGGSFRIPDVMAKSGGILCEVGTTNRTHLRDYENAIENDTGLLLKVHKSNYSVVGFSSEIDLEEMVELGKKYHVPVMEDLGSGTFIDFSKYGLVREPTVQESVKTGADVVTFSGDKLLGGPQAGIIVGKKEILEKIKQNPITRALRIDKLTLAALESTLRLYRDETKAVQSIPTLRMLTMPLEQIKTKAGQLKKMLTKNGGPRLKVEAFNNISRAGGGALPLLELPTRCVGVQVKGMTINSVERAMRANAPPIIGRIEDDNFIMDLRTLQEDEFPVIDVAFTSMMKKV